MVSFYCQRQCYYGPLTTVQKNALLGMITGDSVYDTTLGRMECWNGAAWVAFPAMPGGTYIGLADTPGGHTARAVPYTNATATALAADAQFYYNSTTQTLYVQNLHTQDHIFANGWRIIEDWDKGGLIILDADGVMVKRIGPGPLKRFWVWLKQKLSRR